MRITLIVALVTAMIWGCAEEDSTGPVLQGGMASASGSFMNAVGQPRGQIQVDIVFESLSEVISFPDARRPYIEMTTGPVHISSAGHTDFMSRVRAGLEGEVLELTYAKTAADGYHLSGSLSRRQAEGAPISITFVGAFDGRLGTNNVPVVRDLEDLLATVSIFDGTVGFESNVVSSNARLSVRGVRGLIAETAE